MSRNAAPPVRTAAMKGERIGMATAPTRVTKLAGAVCLAAAVALSGCAATDAIPVPKFSSVKRITKKLLTREEKEAEIRELTMDQRQRREKAEEQLEKR